MLKKVLLIPVGAATLPGLLMLPDGAKALVVFSHGAGSSRNSPRNRAVATHFYSQGIGSLLFDLLTAEEDSEYRNRFNIDLLTGRLLAVTRWISKNSTTAALPVAFFGASTGAAAALKAAAVLPGVFAVVSRGGRPDLAGEDLYRVVAPVLLLVGERDPQVIELNRAAMAILPAKKKLQIIPGAGHLFEEEGKLQEVCLHATAWLREHLPVQNKYSKKKKYVS